MDIFLTFLFGEYAVYPASHSCQEDLFSVVLLPRLFFQGLYGQPLPAAIPLFDPICQLYTNPRYAELQDVLHYPALDDNQVKKLTFYSLAIKIAGCFLYA